MQPRSLRHHVPAGAARAGPIFDEGLFDKGIFDQALAFHRAGLLVEAEQLYRKVAQAQPRHFDALHLMGVIHHQRGDHARAVSDINAALKINPKSFAALNNRGLALKALGRRDDALASYRKAAALKPDFAEAFCNSAIVLRELGRLGDALTACDRAIALKPRYAEAFNCRGNTLGDLTRHDEAIESLRRAIALKPDYSEACNNLGVALARLERFDEALACYDRAIAIDPGYARAFNNRGRALLALGHYDDAIASCDRALLLQPDTLEAHLNRANALDKLDRHEEALAALDRSIVIDARNAGAHVARAIVLRKLRRFDEALASCDAALALERDDTLALAARADVLANIERFDEAVAALDRVIALRPAEVKAQWNKSLLCLALGDFAEGWPLYEHRWAGAKDLVPRPYPQPRWQGERVDGTLLAWGEQGLGDEILCAGLVPELTAFADKVVLEVAPRLATLFARSFPDASVVARSPALYGGSVDAQAPLGSLGRYLRATWDAFPRRDHGYLRADAARVDALRARLANDGRRIIGLSWISRAAIDGRARSAGLSDFATLLQSPGCRFIDLQYGDTQAEREAVRREFGVEVERLPDIDNTNDIDGLAALITACDAVITIDNTTAHLAGALGRPTWVMVPYGHVRIWYWFKDRSESPWYPRVRVRRQADGQPWASVVSTVTDEVSQFLGAKASIAARVARQVVAGAR
jgi:tetratricopeptide (TPR) repeat protein